MRDLNLTLIQFDIIWEKKEENLLVLDELIKKITDSTQLVILPEMFTTGFTMRPERFAEPMNGSSMQWMKEKALQTGYVICGSLIIQENNNYYNRMIWMQPDGNYTTYDKRHMFTLAGEQNHYTAGNQRIITTLNNWKVSLQICYDLRFPVWCRNKNDFDLQIFVANWPDRRVLAWQKLLVARSIENQSYIAAVNRVGYDGNDIYHSGHSMLINPEGEIEWTSADTESVKTVTLSYDFMETFRDKFRFLNDRDDFEVKT